MTDSTQLDELMAYARGFVHNSPQNLALLRQQLDWNWIARQELDRRAALFLQQMSNETLHAIATSELVIPDLAQKL